jgi:Na+/proline symporter
VLLHGSGLLIVYFMLFVVGVSLFAYHTVFPTRLVIGPDADRIFVRFILEQLPSGLRGLLFAAIFAAAMCSASAQLSALSSVCMVDFCKHLAPRWIQSQGVRTARLLTLGCGAASFVATIVVVGLGGVVRAGLRIGTFFSGPLLAIFLLGMFTKRANDTGTLLGSALGLAVLTVVAYTTSISWAWYTLIGAVVSFASGYLFSLLFSSSQQRCTEGLTITQTDFGIGSET